MKSKIKAGAYWVGPKPDDPKPIIYHGCHDSDARTLREGGINSFCLSYYSIWDSGNPHTLDRHIGMQKGSRALLDSGAFSFLVQVYQKRLSRQKTNEIAQRYLVAYAQWLQEHYRQFDFYITFDYLIEAPVIYTMTKQLQTMGIRTVPVYHGDASITWVERYIDEGHKLICLSKRFFLNRRTDLPKFYDQVFNVTEKHGVRCHGLACTVGPEVWNYPWYSVDSTSLVRGSGYGTLTYLDHKGVPHIINISKKTQKIDEEVRHIITTNGFTLNELRDQRTKRVLFNAIMFKKFTDGRENKQWTRRTLF